VPNQDAFHRLNLHALRPKQAGARRRLGLLALRLAPFRPPRFGLSRRERNRRVRLPPRVARLAARGVPWGRCAEPTSAIDISTRAPAGSLDSRITARPAFAVARSFHARTEARLGAPARGRERPRRKTNVSRVEPRLTTSFQLRQDRQWASVSPRRQAPCGPDGL